MLNEVGILIMEGYFTSKDPVLLTVEQVGGKGLSLIFSEKKGFRVPPAAVLSIEFIKPWMERLKATWERKAFMQTKDDGVAAATVYQQKPESIHLEAIPGVPSNSAIYSIGQEAGLGTGGRLVI